MKKQMIVWALLLLLLLTACGQKATLQETIPTLALTAGTGQQSAPVNAFGYSWTAGRDGVVVDTVHPLEARENLPGVSVTAGTAIGLRFSRLPDSVTVSYWPASTGDTPSPWPEETTEASFANNLFNFVLPESEEDLVVLVRGQWDSYSDAKGTVSYAFVVGQE